MSGLYLHIPFCKQACHYCDFHFSTQLDTRSVLVESIIKELGLQKDYLGGDALQTIYFGGGTPSLLSDTELSLVLEAVHKNHPVIASAEVTLEANPDDLSPAKLHSLRRLGINRLSIGVQSFDEEILRYFNRAHTAGEALRCIEDARTAGFDNISIDLIYGTPGLNDSAWLHDIRTAVSLRPDHLSAYSLTIEEKTVFGKQASKGKLMPVPDDQVAVQLELLMSEMANAGYEHYEISNFALPDRHSRHNTSYWEQKPYLGVGPSAHSYNKITRQFNVANNSAYIKSLQAGKLPFDIETLSRSNIINEFIMTRLRTHDGLDLEYLKEEFGYDLANIHSPYLENLVYLGKVFYRGPMLVLTNKGKLLADKISSDLFVTGE